MRFRDTQSSRGVRLEGWAAPMVRDAAHEGCGIWVGLRSRLLTMRAERDREAHQINRNPL